MKKFLILILLTISAASFAGERPEDVYKTLFDPHIVNKSNDDLNYEDHNVLVYFLVFKVSKETGRDAIVTDVCRPGSSGQHEHCNAVDFYLDYSHLDSVCEVREQYLEDSVFILEVVTEFEIPVRIGIYYDLHHHLDITGKKGIWGIDSNGHEVTYIRVYNEIETWIRENC